MLPVVLLFYARVLTLSPSFPSGTLSDLFLPDDVLLCIIDHVVVRGRSDPELASGQRTHNSLSLVSKNVYALVRRVRYKTMFVHSTRSAQLFITQSDTTTRNLVRQQLKSEVFGPADHGGNKPVLSSAFSELLAVLGDTGVQQVTAQGIKVHNSFFWAVRSRQSVWLASANTMRSSDCLQ